MSTIFIDGKELLTADNEFINAPELTEEDLDLSREAQLEEKRKAWRKWEANNQAMTEVTRRWHKLIYNCRRSGILPPLEREEFVNLMYNTTVLDESTGDLTCLASLIGRRDGTITISPLQGDRLVVKYLDTIVLDTSTSN